MSDDVLKNQPHQTPFELRVYVSRIAFLPDREKNHS